MITLSPYLIPCQCCGKNYSDTFTWYICDKCNFRVCPACLHKHTGRYAKTGGSKCSQCAFGYLHQGKIKRY